VLALSSMRMHLSTSRPFKLSASCSKLEGEDNQQIDKSQVHVHVEVGRASTTVWWGVVWMVVD
jgi:hypothetical protein